MISEYITISYLDQFINQSLEEDLGDGDHSTLSIVSEEQQGRAHLLFKENGIAAGMFLVKEIYDRFDPTLKVDLKISDGAEVEKGDVGYIVEGKIRSILSTERLILNCLQRLSGIATKTHHLNQLIKGTNTTLLDTRKTTPGLRALEKWAVKIGGGTNHRFGLFDMIMLKDNHVDYAGGISNAVAAANAYLKTHNKDLKIEVETRNLEEVQEAIDNHVDVIMLDNFTPEEMRKAVELVGGRIKTEASGGITEETIRSYAETGVDYISIGALTHSVKSLDISLKAIFI